MPHCIRGTGLFRIIACTGGPPRTISMVSVCQGVMIFLPSPCIILLNDSKIFHMKQILWSLLLLVRFLDLQHLWQWLRFFRRMSMLIVCYVYIFQKTGYAVCAYLLKSWSCSWSLTVNSLVNQPSICLVENVDHKVICFFKYFNYVLWYSLPLLEYITQKIRAVEIHWLLLL